MRKDRLARTFAALWLVPVVALVFLPVLAGAQEGNLLKNPTFLGAEESIPPPNWNLYGSLANGHRISVIHPDDPAKRALLIEDNVDIPRGNDGEIGLHQTVVGGPGRYRVTVRIGAVEGVSPDVTAVQIRFLPSEEFEHIRLNPKDTAGFDEFVLEAEAPPGTALVRVYLYTWAARTPKIRLQSITLERVMTSEERSKVIGGYAPFTFDLSQSPLNPPSLEELRTALPARRPRLFATPDTIDALRNKRTTSPIARLIWNNITVQALAMQFQPLPPDPPDARPGGTLDITAWRAGIDIANDILNRLHTLGFHYLISGDTQSGEAAKKLLLHVAGWDPYGNSGRAKNDEISMRLLYGMSRAYDWLHPLLTEEERKVVQEAMRHRGNDVYTTMRRIRFEDDLLDNHLTRSMGFLGEAAIAFMGDFPEAEVWFDYVVSLFLVKYPPWGSDEGGWSQGVSYWQSYISWVLDFFDAFKIATGFSLYDLPFMQNTGYFKLYAHPPKSKFGAFGDHSDVPPDTGSARVMGRLALVYNEPAFQWYVDQVTGTGRTPAIPTNTFLGYVLAPESGAPLVEPQLPEDFPQSRYFSDVGWVLMNVDMTDWQNNVHVKFKSSPYGSFNHSHAEQNSFQIEAYGSPLAIPSGYYPWYGSPHHAQWTWQTISKNSIIVDRVGQPSQNINAKGRIIGVSFGPQFDYTAGDATEAYAGRIQRFWRHLLFVKPNLIVIYDQLERERPTVRYDWLLHSLKEMKIDSEANRVLVHGDTAHMWVDFITPESLEFSLTDQFPVAPEEREAHKPNQWHLTATANVEGGRGRFLTVMVPRPNGRLNEAPPETAPIAAEGGHVVRVDMDGVMYRVGFRDAEDEPVLAFEDVTTDATAVVVWQADSGAEHGFMAVGVGELVQGGRQLIRSDRRVDVGVRWVAPEGKAVVQLSSEAVWVELAAPFAVEQVEVHGQDGVQWEYEAGVLRIVLE